MSYYTRDLWLAASLKAKEVPLIGYSLSNDDRRVYFQFDDYERCRKLELMWLNGELEANISAVKEAKTKLKAIISMLEGNQDDRDNPGKIQSASI